MSPGRAELLAELAHVMTAAADGVSADWTGFSVVAEVGPLGVRATGFRYDDGGPARPMLVGPAVIDAIDALRQASPGPGGQLFDVYVARFDRGAGEIVDQAFAAEAGANYRITASNVARIGALIRPGLPFLPPSDVPPPPEADPEPAPPGSVQPAESAAAPTEDPLIVAVTADILSWPELAADDWTSFGGAVAVTADGARAIGFRYRDADAVPTFVGGEYLAHLRTLLAAHPGPTGEPARAALIRLPDRTGPVQVRYVYGTAAQNITWTAADDVMAGRLRPDPSRSTTVPPRPAPDLLDPTALLDRVRADIAASLRGRDSWRSFAFALDIPRNRAVAFVYDDDGAGHRYQPLFAPLADLTELRTQTARPDGSQWAGAVAHTWRSGRERVDVTFYGEAGIGDFLDQGPDIAGLLIRPDADPPEQAPRPPWPPAGGHLDTDALLGTVSRAILTSPTLAVNDWDRLAVVIAFADTTPTVTAVRFAGQAAPIVTPLPDPGPIGKLRRSNPNNVGWLWDACILRGLRGAATLQPEFRFGRDADEFRVDATTITAVADRLRPA